jgi:class 3 adenylate cyclase/tetratricopeptide (TPR) repeat protein
VGDPDDHKLDVLAGELLDELAQAESLAEKGDVVLAPSAMAELSDHLEHNPIKNPQQSGDETFALVRNLNVDVPSKPLTNIAPLNIPDDQLRPWLPKSVYQRLRSGGAEFLAELRPAVALFLRFTGIDYERDQARDLLNSFIQRIQKILSRHEATLLDLTIGDKGSYFYAAFGATIAHEDDPLRAVSAALEMHELVNEFDAIEEIQIGISQGLMRVGTYGASIRGTYGVHGNDVNIAARLMTLAEPGQVLVTERIKQAVSTRFRLDSRGMIPIKGHEKPLPLYVLKPVQIQAQPVLTPSSPLIGRHEEREILSRALRDLLQGEGKRLLIEGEAGIGKTRLVTDLLEQANVLKVAILFGAGDSIERGAPFHAWRKVFNDIFDLGGGTDSGEAAEQVLEKLSENSEWYEQAPLLNPVLPISVEDNEHTSQMSGDLRSKNTLEFLYSLLSAKIQESPTVIVMEDVHWFDSASWALLDKVNAALPSSLLVVTARPLVETGEMRDIGTGGQIDEDYERLRDDPGIQKLILKSLPLDDISVFIRDRLGVSSLPPAVIELIQRLGEGNPLFSEEIALMLREKGIIKIQDGIAALTVERTELESIDFPDTIHGVIASRLDTLPPDQNLTLKVASVIGRIFPFDTLHDVHPSTPTEQDLKDQLDELDRLSITPVESQEPDLAYIFKHSLTQEVVYQHLLFSQRRKLHEDLAAWYEEVHAENITAHVSRIAHHLYEAVKDGGEETALVSKALDYLEQAGDQALQQSAYREAVTLFNRALEIGEQVKSAAQIREFAAEVVSYPMPDGNVRARWIAKIGEAYRGWGRFSKGQEHLESAAKKLGQEVPSFALTLGSKILFEVIKQVLARFNPSRVIDQADHPDRTRILEISRIYQRLGEMYFFSNQKVKSLYTIVKMLNMSGKVGSSPEYAGALAAMSLTTGLFGLHSQAEHYYQRACSIAHRVNRPLTSAEVWRVNGLYRIGIGSWDKAKIDLNRALEIHDRLRDKRHAGDCRTLLCHIEYSQGNFQNSSVLANELVTIGERDENPALKIWGLYQQGASLLHLGDPEAAVEYTKQALALISEHAEGAAEIYCLGILALAYWRLGNTVEAKKSADRLAALIGESRGVPSAYNVLDGYIAAAKIYMGLWASESDLKDDDLIDLRRMASKSYKALHTFRRLFPIGAPSAWRYQGTYEWLSGRVDDARQSWETSAQISKELDMQFDLALAHSELGRRLPVGDPGRFEHLNEAEYIFKQLSTPYELGLVKGAKRGK